MNTRTLFVVGFLGFLALSSVPKVTAANGGACAACTLIVALVEEMALDRKVPIKDAATLICSALTGQIPSLQPICALALDLFVPAIQKDHDKLIAPDVTCKTSINLCGPDWLKCKIFNVWPPPPSATQSTLAANPNFQAALLRAAASGESFPESDLLKGLDENARDELREQMLETYRNMDLSKQLGVSGIIMQLMEMLVPKRATSEPEAGIDHLPAFDTDKDRFSTVKELRGSHWRGKDCDDLNAQVYPGRRATTLPPARDHNCNGILGTDPTGVAYEDKWCAKVHGMTNHTFDNLLPVVEDEADWPHCSAWNAYPEDLKTCPFSIQSIVSFYMLMRDRNRCNHRDYQNIGVNGARSSNMKPPGNILSMKSRNGTDNPAIVFLALVGNDVCNGHAGFDSMTSVAEFEQNTIAVTNYLEANLAPNSTVVFVGLVDGRILFSTMANLWHPLGAKYSELYDFLNCLEMNPCWGWLNTNATARDLTTQRAFQLNAVYQKIARERTYRNFNMMYIDTPSLVDEALKEWIAAGHKASEFIEIVDGFHPSTDGQVLVAKKSFEYLLKTAPQVLGPVNPFNQQIIAQFNNQGGH